MESLTVDLKSNETAGLVAINATWGRERKRSPQSFSVGSEVALRVRFEGKPIDYYIGLRPPHALDTGQRGRLRGSRCDPPRILGCPERHDAMGSPICLDYAPSISV